ncbi:MAG: crotonase/enoyl-CoA hydratase family protein [Myxococcaceae bacterium]|nr:crotonase/enoyl-CoA hydratase family protein [Myxococcaceae bacterium]
MSVRVEKQGPVTTVILQRPEARNAVDGPTAVALHDAFVAFEADASASVAVLFGDGGTFCAGADLKALGSERQNRVEAAGPGPMGPSRLQLSKPVIAAVAGHAVAGGLELACWCDLRVVEEDAVFGVFCRRWGVPLIDGGTVRLPRLIGQSRAMDLILTGRAVGAAEALAIGLANRVVRKGEARAAAEALAHELAAFPQTCLRADRRSALAQWGLEESEALAQEFEGGLEALRAEGVAGAARFAQGAGRHGAFR